VNFIDLCIQRPVLTWMMALSLIVFGVLGYNRLGVDRYPDMDFPNVTVSAHLEGASPEVMEEDVTDVLEEYLNTISGVHTLRSTTAQGIARISVQFDLDRDIDLAAQDVRDKVARARGALPPDLDPPVVDKMNMGDFPIMWIPLKTERTAVEASEFVRTQIKPRLETAPGVASVSLFGRRDRNIRIWLDGDDLRARGLAASDVLAALSREHVEVPGGDVESDVVQYAVKTEAEFASIESLRNLVVAWKDDAPVRLRDVARVEDGAEDATHYARYDGRPAVGVGIIKQSDANTVAVADEILDRMQHSIKPMLPRDMELKEGEGLADFSTGIREAVAETQFALVFGALLAVLTVFVFLRRTRPTMIVALAIPLSLIASFGAMWIFGFTLNVMTLLALALAVGVVIDDAIVVLENIERRREAGEGAAEAASKGTRQIAFAATAATLSIAVVFVPVIFVKGIVGNFLGDFGVTVASAVMVSLFVALTLTPMLAARMPPPGERAHGSVYHRLEQGFRWLEESYRRILHWTLRSRRTRFATLALAGLAFVLALVAGSRLGTEFFPPTDEGFYFIRAETAPGTTLNGTVEYLKRNEAWVLEQPEVAGLFAAVGAAGGGRRANTNEMIMFAMLTSRHNRERSAQELIKETRAVLGMIPGQQVHVYDTSSMQAGGSHQGTLGFELRGNVALERLDELADQFITELEKRGGYVDLDKSLKLGLPELRVIPDREKAAALGVDAASLANAVRVMIGGLDVATFKEGGKRFDIRARLEEKDRRDPSAIERLYVRTRTGDVVELRNLVDIETGAAPQEITRSDRQRSVTVFGNLDGKTLGRAIEEAREVAAHMLPEGVSMRPSGQAEAFQQGAGQFGLALGLAILVIYMVLAAQFESLVHPLTVMLALPLAMVGALGGLLLTGHTLNLFSMIGILLLFGLATKNSILLVDFAIQLRNEGLEKVEAMRRAAPIRLRPVLMTGVSMIFGVLPAALGIGPGSETRQPMAIATAAGMFSSMMLTLLVVPVFYVFLDDAVAWLKRGLRRLLRRPADPGLREPSRAGTAPPTSEAGRQTAL
jgi:HAE1 family hydrophobic/amphiphilic exporter-1